MHSVYVNWVPSQRQICVAWLCHDLPMALSEATQGVRMGNVQWTLDPCILRACRVRIFVPSFVKCTCWANVKPARATKPMQRTLLDCILPEVSLPPLKKPQSEWLPFKHIHTGASTHIHTHVRTHTMSGKFLVWSEN